jgi:hypothetical protein
MDRVSAIAAQPDQRQARVSAMPSVRSQNRVQTRLSRRARTGAGATDRHRARLHLPGLPAHLGPELYLYLARVLGFETPAGVIE